MAAAAALGVVGVAAYAHGVGPGMMGSYGGYGMDPGMMGSHGGYGMGPGMMGGHGGYGMGPGMMGGGNLAVLDRLDLSDHQRKQMSEIQNTFYKKSRDVMEQMHDEMEKLHGPSSSSGERDWDAVLASSKRVNKLREQMFENAVEAARKAEAILTPQQRKQYEQSARSCHGYDN